MAKVSFFGSADDVDLTDSSEDEEISEREAKRLRQEEEKIVAEKASKDTGLPPVSDLFAKKEAPSFKEAPKGVVVREIQSFDTRKVAEKPKPWLDKRQTVAVKKPDDFDQPVPPNSYAAELQNAAMMNSRAYKDTDAVDVDALKKDVIPISQLHKVNQKEKVPKSNKRDPKSFAAKEKRKRDFGMQSRGKSTVEEEKRILRGYAAGSGQGFD
eukprot:m.607628 g.607628  ORF g.607628 m.607628 type:complete len:212 (-) comp22479_c0_seq1:2050-2685(-)